MSNQTLPWAAYGKILAFEAALFLLFIMIACGQSNSAPTAPSESNLTYFRDGRTNLCFAAINSNTKDGWDVMSITNVPCAAVPADLLKK